MQEPYKEGLANHLDPQSCAGGRETAGEALTGAHAGQPLTSEITLSGVPTLYGEGEGNMADGANREPTANAAESETLCMRGNSMRENRETSQTPYSVGCKGRPEKAFSRTFGVHVCEESDDLIVPAKRANKAGPTAAAESVEGRGSREGTVLLIDHVPDTAPDSMGGWRQDHGPRHCGVGASDPSEEPYEVILHVRI
jgi:RNA-directed DNA polymerase